MFGTTATAAEKRPRGARSRKSSAVFGKWEFEDYLPYVEPPTMW